MVPHSLHHGYCLLHVPPYPHEGHDPNRHCNLVSCVEDTCCVERRLPGTQGALAKQEVGSQKHACYMEQR